MFFLLVTLAHVGGHSVVRPKGLGFSLVIGFSLIPSAGVCGVFSFLFLLVTHTHTSLGRQAGCVWRA